MAPLFRWSVALVALLVVQANLAAERPQRGVAPAQFQAQVTVQTAAPGKPWKTIAMPKLVFVAGSDAEVQIAGDAHDIRLKISTPEAGKEQFLIEATIIANPKAKAPQRLAAPRMLLEAGNAGQIQVGEVLRIDAKIEKTAAK